MKKTIILSLICLFCCVFGFGQQNGFDNRGFEEFQRNIKERVENEPKGQVIIDSKLMPYVNQYVADVKKYLRKDVRHELYALDSIVFKEMPFPYMGKTKMENFKMKRVYINKWTQMDTLIMKAVVYHELSHALLGITGHACQECNHLLSANPPKSHIIFAQDWDKYVKELFITSKAMIREEKKARKTRKKNENK